MKRALMTLCLAGIMGSTVYAKNPIDRREHNQKERIQQGVKSGELTRAETQRLVAAEARIRAAEARAKADGDVTAREALRLNQRLGVVSKQIAKQKHDRQDR